jgi:4,5-dihydroxyphthalate decarboxylase
MQSKGTASSAITAAIGQRYDFLHLWSGKVKPDGLDLEFSREVQGAPSVIFSRLAREHPWDVGEQGFSTYLMAFDLGTPHIALPVFPSHFFPHAGLWVSTASGIEGPGNLLGKKIGCGSWGTNYSVWLRGTLAHQYDVSVEKITWVESVEEHLPEYRPPKRFSVERIAGNKRAGVLLAEGKIDAASLAGGGAHREEGAIQALFENPYPEIRDYVERTGCFPINTVITLRRDVVERIPRLPSVLMEAFREAKQIYNAELAEGKHDEHMGLELARLKSEAEVELPDYGFRVNRSAIRTMIAYCYEQGIIRRLLEPEELFLLTDT